MTSVDPKLSIDAIYLRLTEIIKNDAQQPLDIVGSYIVGCAIVEEGIEDLFEKYPTLEEIADVGSELEYQGEEYFDDYYDKLTSLIKKLGEEINAAS